MTASPSFRPPFSARSGTRTVSPNLSAGAAQGAPLVGQGPASECQRDSWSAADFPRVGRSFAELTILRRQRPGTDPEGFRHDLALAQWFGGEAPSALAEEAWGQVLTRSSSDTLRFEQWDRRGPTVSAWSGCDGLVLGSRQRLISVGPRRRQPAQETHMRR